MDGVSESIEVSYGTGVLVTMQVDIKKEVADSGHTPLKPITSEELEALLELRDKYLQAWKILGPYVDAGITGDQLPQEATEAKKFILDVFNHDCDTSSKSE